MGLRCFLRGGDHRRTEDRRAGEREKERERERERERARERKHTEGERDDGAGCVLTDYGV